MKGEVGSSRGRTQPAESVGTETAIHGLGINRQAGNIQCHLEQAFRSLLYLHPAFALVKLLIGINELQLCFGDPEGGRRSNHIDGDCITPSTLDGTVCLALVIADLVRESDEHRPFFVRFALVVGREGFHTVKDVFHATFI